jgi:hypothetical protein
VNEPSQLVLFGNGLDEGISDGFPNRWLYSYPFYREMQKRNHVFSDVAAAFSMTDKVHGFVQGRSEAELMNVHGLSYRLHDWMDQPEFSSPKWTSREPSAGKTSIGNPMCQRATPRVSLFIPRKSNCSRPIATSRILW